MPIYEYRCGACGWQQEILQKMSDAPLKDCPECGKPSVTKMVTAAGFQLKGSGWYATDFKGGAKPQAKADDKTAAKADDKTAAKPDDKPAAKSGDKPAADAPAKKADVAAPAATTTTNPAGS
jgi:putative FmdB family regulatory protein